MYENKRIKFVDSDDEDAAMHGDADLNNPQATTQPAPTTTNFHLLSSINTDFDQRDQCYVLQLANNPTSSLIAAALSNKHIKLFSLRESALQFTGNLAGHTSMITDIQTAIPEDPYMLFSSSSDKTIKSWDLRSSQPIESYTIPNAEAACCSCNGTLLAAGGKDNVYFWDRRTRKPLIAFTDTHATDVTQVKFHPHHRSAFISGSEDGLIAVFDLNNSNNNNRLDEDEGFRAALNIDTAVAKIGFYKDRLWCCSGTETLHLWEWAAACNDEVEGGNGALGDAHDVREQACIDTDHPHADYLLQCEYDEGCDELAVAVGAIDGTVALCRVEEPPSHSIGNSIKIGSSMAVMRGGHSDIVRSMACVRGVNIWLTGGEDGRICVWSSSAELMPSVSEGETSSGGPMPRQQGHMRRVSPY